jgi:hypothetical protein
MAFCLRCRPMLKTILIYKTNNYFFKHTNETTHKIQIKYVVVVVASSLTYSKETRLI